MKPFFLSGLGAILLGLSAHATLAATMVEDVQVEVDLTAIENPEAASFWANVGTDLENAIVARLTERITDDGITVSVDIDEVELANAFQNAIGTGENRIAGTVKFTSQPSNATDRTFDLAVNVENAIVFLPAGYDVALLSTNSREFYDAMIAAYAGAVVQRLDD